MIDKIRSATNGNYVPGSGRFTNAVSAMLTRCVTLGKAGRPRKTSGEVTAERVQLWSVHFFLCFFS